MAAAVLWTTLSLTAVRTALVIDGVWEENAGQGVILRIAQWLSTRKPSKLSRDRQVSQLQAGSSGSGSLQQEQGDKNCDTSLRLLHGRLLMMHVVAILAQSVGVAKYTVQASATPCLVTQRLMVALFVLYDATLVLFLLAKTYAINISHTASYAPSCWVRIVTWWSLFWGWIYLPVLAVVIGSTFPGGMNIEGDACSGGIVDASDTSRTQFTARFLLSKCMLMVEARCLETRGLFVGHYYRDDLEASAWADLPNTIRGEYRQDDPLVLLLAVFSKPLLVRQTANQSFVAERRSTIVRSITCTVGMFVTYMIGTLTVFFVAVNSASVNKATQFADAWQAVQSFLTLCLAEVIVPLGFTGCVESCVAGARKFRDVDGTTRDMASVVPSKTTGKSLCQKKAVSPTNSSPRLNIAVKPRLLYPAALP